MQRPSRRQILQANAAVSLGAIAGYSALRSAESTAGQNFTRLQRTALYFGDDVGLTIPDEIQTIRATNNADLIILTDTTDVSAEQVVEWLAAERTLALLGGSIERIWLVWARSDPSDDTYVGDATSDSEPDPYLLVGTAGGPNVTTYRRSWGDSPRDRDILRALDEVLVEIENRTPQ